MNKDCVVCGAEKVGTISGYDLCRPHYDATRKVDEHRALFTKGVDQRERLLRFQRDYPEVGIEPKTSLHDAWRTAAKFLTYSFKDIGFKYSELTNVEKKLCSKAEFEMLISWVKRYNET